MMIGMSEEYGRITLTKIDDYALEQARWAACDVREEEDMKFGSMEYNCAVAEASVQAYIEALFLDTRG
jgi:hypothetical protein